MTSELRPAVEVWDDAIAAWAADTIDTRQAAAAVIQAYGDEREAKFKALAETLAGAVREIKDSWDWWQVDTYDRCSSVVEDAINEALREYKEARDAS